MEGEKESVVKRLAPHRRIVQRVMDASIDIAEFTTQSKLAF